MTETQEKKFYSAKYDRAFKEVMLKEENKGILKELLEKVLKEEIKDIEYRPTERLTGNVNIKGKRLDLLLTTNQGIINVEVNSWIEEYSRERNMAYISNIYTSKTKVGEDYDKNINVIQINFTYGLSKENKKSPIIKTEQEEYMVQNEKGEKYVKNFKIIEVNMDYYCKIWYDKKEREIQDNSVIIMLGLGEKGLEELSKKDKVVEKFMEEIKKVNQDPIFIDWISEEEDRRKLYNTMIHRAENRGREEGKEEGIEETQKEMIKKLYAEGVSLEILAKSIDKTTEEVEKIINL